MSNKDFQNGFALGLASGAVVEVPAKEEHEKTITITENGTTEILPDNEKVLSKVTVVTEVESDGNSADEPVFEIETLSTTLPHNLHASATARVGDKIYMFGGYNSADGSRTNTILIYDITNDVLSYSTQTLGENINDFPAVVVGTDIYTFGGNKGSGNTINKIYKYDTLTDTLEHYDSFITPICSCAACYYNGYVYIFGGQKSSTYFNTIYRYDIANKTSELLDITLPQKTMGITSSGVLVGDVFYIFGGTSSSTGTSGYNTIYAIDLLNQTVDTLDFVLPYGARDISAIYHNGAIYMFGGKSGSVKSDMLVFKPDYEGVRFISGMLPSATCNINISRYNNKIYLIGGEGLKTISVVSIEEAEETTLSVEYIESTGTQYIDTGIIPTNHRVVAKFQYTAMPNASDVRALFGNFNAAWTKAFCLAWYNNAWYYASGMSYEGIVSGATLCTDLQEMDFNNYEGKFLINGVEYGDTNGTVDISQTMPIFCRKETDGSIISSALSSIRLYYFKIYDRETEELVRDFIPAIDDSGVVCLYDNVTETYFYNQGTGEFKGSFIEKVETNPLNLAYGETAPEDTSKLWIKANEPNKIDFITSGGVGATVDNVLTIPSIDGWRVSNLNTIYMFANNTNGVYKLNVQSNILTKISDKNIVGGYNTSSHCYCNGKIYTFGGTTGYSSSSSTNQIFCYDIATDELTTKNAVLPAKMWGVACCSVGDYIYTFGGNNGSMQTYICKYDTINDNLEIAGYLNTARPEIATCLIGTKIYLFGGYPAYDTIQCFDTADNSLSTMTATLTNGRCYIGASNIGTDIYLFGGKARDTTQYNYIEKYDTLTDTISVVLNTSDVSGYVNICLTYNNVIYVVNDVDVKCFTPKALPLEYGNIAIKQKGSFNLVDICGGIKIGVENVFIGNENNKAELVEAYLHNGTEWQKI